MNKQRSIEIKVGVVSFLALLLFVLGISLGKNWAVTGQQPEIRLRFPHSGGIEVSAPVTINGVKRGQVLSVRPDRGSVLVTASIDDISDLSNDAEARITMLEITGGKKIEIDPGKSAEKLSPDKEIRGVTSMDVADLVAMAGELAGDVQGIVRSIDTITVAVKNILQDTIFIADVKQAAASANRTMAGIETLVTENEGRIHAAIRNVEALSSELRQAVASASPKADSLLDNLHLAVRDARGVLVSVDTTITNADRLIDDIGAMIYDVKHGQGLATKILYDERLAQRLDSTLVELNRFVKKVRIHGLNTNVRIGTRP